MSLLHTLLVHTLLSLQESGGKTVTLPFTSRQVAPTQSLGCVQAPNAQQSMLHGSLSAQFGTLVFDPAGVVSWVVGQFEQALSQASV